MEIGIIALVALVFVLSLIWTSARGRTIIDRWATANGVRILQCERRFLRRGPFFWRTTRGQEVFYVTVEDGAGQVRHAYVRCGSWILGLFSDQATAEWAD